jgi:uncharacterized protein
MIIDLRHILEEPRQFDFTFHPGWWQDAEGDDQIMGLEGPIVVSGTIRKEGESFALDGALKGHLKIRCDRCLEPYQFQLDSRFRLVLTPASAGEQRSELGLIEEDLSVRFIEDLTVDVDEMVREQIYLSLPMKCLCKETCAGLCPECGQNLNIQACVCQKETGHPAFSKLKDLKVNGS